MPIHTQLLVPLVKVQGDACLPDSHLDKSFICAKQADQKFTDD